jgi:glycine/D-amino acid oxidase-like deaminating enzyme
MLHVSVFLLTVSSLTAAFPVSNLNLASGTANRHLSSRKSAIFTLATALPNMSEKEKPKNVVILGGGIIGSSIAYHLSKRGVAPLVVERSKVGAAASGKAGGFLAGGWGDGSVTQQLHRVSFRMHEELAKELGIKSFRKIETLSVAGGRKGKGPFPVSWLDGQVSKASLMDKWTAQVTPLELTEALMAGAVARGARLQIGRAEGVRFDSAAAGARRITAVVVDGAEVPCDCVIVAMGPWSCIAEQWFDTPIPMVRSLATPLEPPASMHALNRSLSLPLAVRRKG